MGGVRRFWRCAHGLRPGKGGFAPSGCAIHPQGISGPKKSDPATKRAGEAHHLDGAVSTARSCRLFFVDVTAEEQAADTRIGKQLGRLVVHPGLAKFKNKPEVRHRQR